MKLIYISVFVLLAQLVGCSHVPMATENEDLLAKRFVPSHGKGLLYIHRHEFYRVGHTLPLTINGINIGQLAPQTYAALELDEGSYIIESQTAENTAQLEITVHKGDARFVWLEAKMAMATGSRSELHEVSADFGRNAVLSSKRAMMVSHRVRIRPLE